MIALIQGLFFTFVFVLGAAIGSFLNVVVYRLPAGESLLWPASRCPSCGHALGVQENIPVFGWLRLRGLCRWCRVPISPRYPLVEAATGLLFCVAFAVSGWTMTTVGNWLLVSWLLALSLIDWDTKTLPNELTASGLVVGILFHMLVAWSQGEIVAIVAMKSIGSATLGLWVLDAIALIGTLLLGQVAMGGGDPKLLALIGAWLSWPQMLLSAFVACFLGAFIGAGAIALGWLQRREGFPFGPCLAAGALISLWWGDFLIQGYLNLFFPGFL